MRTRTYIKRRGREEARQGDEMQVEVEEHRIEVRGPGGGGRGLREMQVCTYARMRLSVFLPVVTKPKALGGYLEFRGRQQLSHVC